MEEEDSKEDDSKEDGAGVSVEEVGVVAMGSVEAAGEMAGTESDKNATSAKRFDH